MKKMKKIFPLLGVILILTVAVLFYESCSGRASDPTSGGDGGGSFIDTGGDDTNGNGNGNGSGNGSDYPISTAEDLMALTTNTGDYSGKTVKFMENIDMTGKEFDGIPNFAGTMDGNGKTIENLTMTHDGFVRDNYALVRILENGGVIKNLTISNGTIHGNNNVGAFVGQSRGTTTITGVTNILVSVVTTGNSTGGIVGFVSTGSITIENTKNMGSIDGQYGTGGIIGAGSVSSTINIFNAENANEITGKANIGGIIGSDTSTSTSTIRQVINFSKIMGTYAVGGIVGRSVTTSIQNAGNSGYLESSLQNYTGGIIGLLENNTSTVNIEFAYNYNGIPPGNNNMNGGIIGGASEVNHTITLSNIYFLDTSNNSSYSVAGDKCIPYNNNDVGKITTTGTFGNQSTFVGWDFSTIWQMGADYPLLR